MTHIQRLCDQILQILSGKMSFKYLYIPMARSAFKKFCFAQFCLFNITSYLPFFKCLHVIVSARDLEIFFVFEDEMSDLVFCNESRAMQEFMT